MLQLHRKYAMAVSPITVTTKDIQHPLEGQLKWLQERDDHGQHLPRRQHHDREWKAKAGAML